jgi:hypothetical protein
VTTHKITLAIRNEKRFIAVRRYRAECEGCPWRGEWRRAQDDAVADGDFHRAWAKEDAAA